MRRDADPFGGDGNWWEDAVLNWGSDERVGLVLGYRLAANRLVEQCLETGEQDLLIYPILFLYRHHLELAIKCAIATAKTYLRQSEQLICGYVAPAIAHEPQPRKYRHNLESAWNDLEMMLGDLNVPKDDQLISHARVTVQKFFDLDASGTAFRYADGTPDAGIRSVTRLNLPNLREVASQAGVALESLNDWLSHLIDTGNDILAEHEGGMPSPDDFI